MLMTNLETNYFCSQNLSS